MTALELQTASKYGIGVKVLVLNNEFQGMVLQWQGEYPPISISLNIATDVYLTDLFYDARYSHTRMQNPDFVKLAEAMNVKALRCRTADELPEKMKEFLEHPTDKPVLMECLVSTSEHVFPMVPAGKALHEQLLHPNLRKA